MVLQEVLLNVCFKVWLIVYSWHPVKSMAESIAKSIVQSMDQSMAESLAIR